MLLLLLLVCHTKCFAVPPQDLKLFYGGDSSQQRSSGPPSPTTSSSTPLHTSTPKSVKNVPSAYETSATKNDVDSWWSRFLKWLVAQFTGKKYVPYSNRGVVRQGRMMCKADADDQDVMSCQLLSKMQQQQKQSAPKINYTARPEKDLLNRRVELLAKSKVLFFL
jgi:hypothetical protein